MNPYKIAVLSALVAAIISTHAATLHEGDMAPKLDVAKWVQGEPVTEFKPGTTYLVVFWATWCGPCREEIPYLNQLQTKYQDRGLVVIGQDVKEKNATNVVTAFVKHMGRQMTYRIALDQVSIIPNRPGTMDDTWLKATDQTGIPATFLIDKQGRIALIDEMDEASIEQVLAGTFDAKKRAIEQTTLSNNIPEWNHHRQLFSEAVRSKQWDQSLSEINQMDQLLPPKNSSITRFTRIYVLMAKGDFNAASDMSSQLCNDNQDDASLQNRIVQLLTLHTVTNTVVLNTADRIIQRAIFLTDRKNPLYVDTQARVAFLQGSPQKAIVLESEAISLAETGKTEAFRRALDSYQAGKLPQSQ